MASTKTMIGVAALMAVQAWAAHVTSADGPAATPPAPTTPADNDLDHARRGAGQSSNDAGRAVGNAMAVKQAPDAAHDAKSGDAGPTAADADAIRTAIADLVAVAVTPDHLDRLTQRFAQPDRDRIRAQPGYAENYGPTLDDTAHGFESAWRGKYGHPFAAAAAATAMVDAFATVRQEAGPKAQVVIAASPGLPQATLSLGREVPDGWKADVPDTVDVDALRKDLSDELAAAVAIKDLWPADEAEAYRAVTHRVVLALLNQPLPPAAQRPGQ